jgi:hypothetical protein
MLTQVSATQQSQQQGLNALNEAVQNQQSAIEAQQKEMDDLQASLAAAPDGPFAWAELRGLEREMLWRRLSTWVTWLEDRYLRNLSVSRQGIGPPRGLVPAPRRCGDAHGTDGRAFRRLPRESGTALVRLVDWHEQALWPTLARMEALGLFKRETRRGLGRSRSAQHAARQQPLLRWLDADVQAHLEDRESNWLQSRRHLAARREGPALHELYLYR